jgi:hypothetical protein
VSERERRSPIQLASLTSVVQAGPVRSFPDDRSASRRSPADTARRRARGKSDRLRPVACHESATKVATASLGTRAQSTVKGGEDRPPLRVGGSDGLG